MSSGFALRQCKSLCRSVASHGRGEDWLRRFSGQAVAGTVLRNSFEFSPASRESHGRSLPPRESHAHADPKPDRSFHPAFRATTCSGCSSNSDRGVGCTGRSISSSSAVSSGSSDRSAAGRNSRGGGGDSLSLPGVKHIVAVASAKGGVGKSTTAVNLAVALSRHMRLQVGLLDADVFGPSLPKLLGLHTAGRPVLASPSPNARMLPLQAHGVLCMSMGFLMPADVAAVWRGPMVMAAVEKLVRGTEWGRLDVLVVDMPPGTGDVQLSMSQRVRLSGAVVVSTPQDLALMDARRGVTMFRQVNVPVLGVVENMSYFTCPACSHRSNIFGHGGARQAAADLEIEFLAEVPLLPSIRSRSDSGLPVALGASAAAASGIESRAADSGSADSGAAEGGAAQVGGTEAGGAEGGGAAEEGAGTGSGGAEEAVVATYERMARRVWEKLEERALEGGGAQGPAIVND